MTKFKFELGDAVKTLVDKCRPSNNGNWIIWADKGTWGVICDTDHIDTGVVTVELMTRRGIPTVFDYKVDEIEFVERPK